MLKKLFYEFFRGVETKPVGVLALPSKEQIDTAVAIFASYNDRGEITRVVNMGVLLTPYAFFEKEHTCDDLLESAMLVHVEFWNATYAQLFVYGDGTFRVLEPYAVK